MQVLNNVFLRKGFIYCIKSPNIDKVYIGSTFNDINKRFKQHLVQGTSTSNIIIMSGDASVELIEEIECENRTQLNKREGHHIQNTNNCINKNIAGRTLAESQKAYQTKHKEWYRDYINEWKQLHKEHCREYQKRYREMKKAGF
jgi:hypothetical protein